MIDLFTLCDQNIAEWRRTKFLVPEIDDFIETFVSYQGLCQHPCKKDPRTEFMSQIKTREKIRETQIEN